MYSVNLEENTINDLSIITDTIKSSFSDRNIYIEAEMQSEVQLSIKLTSSKSLDIQRSINIIAKLLNSINAYPIIHVLISGFSAENSKNPVWNGYLNLKSGKFVDNTGNADKTKILSIAPRFQKASPIPLICGILTTGISMAIFIQKPQPIGSSAQTPPLPLPALFMGKGESGYELWLQGECIHVKGAVQTDFARLNTNLQGFKDAIEKDTGVTCIIFD